jgi:thiol-disulfide isomerase/thioredoxin
MALINRALFIRVVIATLALHAASSFAAEPLDLSAHQGKVVLVDFWASWCEPCRHSFPWLNDMQAKYGDRLVVIGVNVDRERADAERFLAQVPAHFQVIYDPAGDLATRYEVMGMPSSYVFDTTGKLVDKHIGFRKSQRAEREAQLQALLAPASRRSHRLE